MSRTKIRFAKPDQAAIEWAESRGCEVPKAYDNCLHCVHLWHGLRCNSCYCATSNIPMDDTWRTYKVWAEEVKLLQIMTDTGCDGWVARKIRATQKAGKSLHVKAALYGREP